MVISKESFGENISECVIFLVKVEDACVVLCSISNSLKWVNQDHENLRVSSFINLLFIVLQEEGLETVSKSVTANMDRCPYIMFKADKEDRERKSIDVAHGRLDM